MDWGNVTAEDLMDALREVDWSSPPRPLAEFFSKFTLPRSYSKWNSRLKCNLYYYRTNYFLMIILILALGFFRKPVAIVAAILTALSIAFLNDRDEMSLQYSPMSEDFDDARYSEAPPNTSMSQPESRPTSPCSPHRYYRPLNGYSLTTSTLYPSFGCPPTSATCPQPRQRGSDSEGRFPSSPSDICHSADLRRAALLRSVQMRVHPVAPPAYELSFSPEHEPTGNIEAQEHPCSCVKPIVNDCECPHPQQGPNSFAEGCSSMGMSESEISREKPCRVLDMNVTEEDSRKAFGGDRLGRTDLMSS